MADKGTDGSGRQPARLGWRQPDRLPSAAECTVRPLLERWASETPEKTFALFEGGERWTYRNALAEARDGAATLFGLGVGKDDLVLNWLSNGAAQLRYWLGAAFMGAVHVPVADTARAGELEHIFASSGASLLVTDRERAKRLPGVAFAGMKTLLLVDGDGSDADDLPIRIIGAAAAAAQAIEPPGGELGIADIGMVIYTSGTTGAPKGVRNTNAQFWTLAEAQHGYLTPDDRVLIATSLAHISTAGMVLAALMSNASVAIFERFSARAFWSRLAETGCTAVPGMGPAIVEMLLKAPPSADDRRHALHIVNVRAPSPAVRTFAERFGVDYYAAFGMTEASCIALSDLNSDVEGSCGRARPGLQVRLIAEDGADVPVGEVGEIAFRANLPETVSAGYHRDPEATARSWRDGWFHTGDLARRDECGNLFFHDRSKDCIRRRGENISSQEVEREALSHPLVANAAVIGVPGPFEDQEILLVVEPINGRTVLPKAIAAHIAGRLAYFKVPRFICVRSDLPRTTFGKLRKFEIAAGIDLAECWDGEAIDSLAPNSPAPGST